jgi:glycine/D-amino acid oxidase-like deaminating enzyme
MFSGTFGSAHASSRRFLKRLLNSATLIRMSKVIIVGAGVNGVTTAIELKKRGYEVVLIDPGPLPHPLAASTDISKAVRATYGADEDYTALAE